jgi:hypothetical protein
MSSPTRAADDFAAIRQRIAEMEAEKKAAEMAKVQPDYSQVYGYGGYQAPYDYDPA